MLRGATQHFIKRIALYRVELPLYEGAYRWAGGKSISVFDATVVKIETRAASWVLVRIHRLETLTFRHIPRERGLDSKSWPRASWV